MKRKIFLLVMKALVYLGIAHKGKITMTDKSIDVYMEIPF